MFSMMAAGAELAAQSTLPHFRRHFVTHILELKMESLDRAKVLSKETPLVSRTFAAIHYFGIIRKKAEEMFVSTFWN